MSRATHVRAGEITTRRLSATLSYEVTLTAYYVEQDGRDAAASDIDQVFCFGDNSTEIVPQLVPGRLLNGRTSSISHYRITHTFPGPGVYTISAEIVNRNMGASIYAFTDTGNDLVARDGNTSRVLTADSSYCYRMLTRGRYTDVRLATFGTLQNYSQISCAMPTDTTRPCPVSLGLDLLTCASLTPESQCGQTNFTNKLRWRQTSGITCDPNVASYKIHYGRYSQDTPGLLTCVNAPTTTFDHSSLTTVAGR